MAFERLLRLTKKCPCYVVSRLRNASVGIATVTQKSFESQYYITRALFGTRSLFAMTRPLPLHLHLDKGLPHKPPTNCCPLLHHHSKHWLSTRLCAEPTTVLLVHP